MTEYEAIEVERHGRVEVIAFNRPDALNSFSPTMTREFIQALDAANADPEVGAIVSTGRGRAYSSGADMSGFARRQAGEVAPASSGPTRSAFDPHFLAQCKPIIGAINGYAIGMGFTGPLNFDVLIASTEARFSARFAAIGLTPEIHSTWLLPKIVGVHRAKEMFLTGRIYTGAEAQDFGLVRRVVEPDELLPEAIALAQEIAANPASSLSQIKELVWNDLLDTDFDLIQRRSGERFSASVQSIEGREAVRAFAEKRPAKFHDVEHMAQLAEELASKAAVS